MSKQEADTVRSDGIREKTLALSEGSGSANAYCISSYGAFQAVSMLSPNGIREVFCDTPEQELRKLAESVKETYEDWGADPDSFEGEIKDLAYKRQIILKLARSNREKDLTTMNEDGRFENFSEE